MKAWLRQLWAVVWRLIGGVSLRVKIMGMVLAMIVLIGAGLAWQVRAMTERVLTSELERRGVFIAEDLVNKSGDLIAGGYTDDLYELAQSTLRSDVDVRYVLVVDAQGNLLTHTLDGAFSPDLLGANKVARDQPYHLETMIVAGERVLDVAISVPGEQAGVARVGLSTRGLDETVASVTRQMAITGLLISVIEVALGTALTWLFTNPVLALTDALRRVADGDLSRRLVPWSDDEIGRAQGSFNVMTERLASSRHEMEVSHQRLERRNRELSVLYAVSRAVAGPLALTQVLERALQQAIGLVDSSGGWICLLGDDDFCQVCVQAGEGSLADIGQGHCEKCTRCREAVKTRQPLIIDPLPPDCPLHDGDCAGNHAVVPLLAKERVVGLLNLVCEGQACFGQEELDLLTNLGRQLGVIIENARLWEVLQNREALRGQLLRRIITAQEEERLRIARELHDEAGQALTSLLVGLRVIEKAKSMDTVRTLISDLKGVVAQTLDDVRDLAMELRPSVLDDLGLVPALERYVQSCPTRFGFEADFVSTGIPGGRRLPPEVETTLYRIAQEALTNVARHASAHRASVLLQRRDGVVVLVVDDDGVGFDTDQLAASPQERGRLGLYGIEERASLVGGHLTIESEVGAGTTVSVEIPLEGTWPIEEARTSSNKAHPSES